MRLGRTLDPVLGIIVAVGNEADDLVGAFGRATNNARNEIDRLSNLKLMHTNSSHCGRMFRHECGRVSVRRASVPGENRRTRLASATPARSRLDAQDLHARFAASP